MAVAISGDGVNDIPPPDERSAACPGSRRVEEQAAYFVVRDAYGQQLGYFYFEEEPSRRSAAKPLGKDERGGSRPAW